MLHFQNGRFQHKVASFDLEECADHVAEDVRGELAAHNTAYQRHMAALHALDAAFQELTDRQRAYLNILDYALSKLEHTVCDSLWAGGILSAFPLTKKSDSPAIDVLTVCGERISQREAFHMALIELRQAYCWAQMCVPETLHEPVEAYTRERLRGLRLIAAATVEHGVMFGTQVLEKAGV